MPPTLTTGYDTLRWAPSELHGDEPPEVLAVGVDTVIKSAVAESPLARSIDEHAAEHPTGS